MKKELINPNHIIMETLDQDSFIESYIVNPQLMKPVYRTFKNDNLITQLIVYLDGKLDTIPVDKIRDFSGISKEKAVTSLFTYLFIDKMQGGFFHAINNKDGYSLAYGIPKHTKLTNNQYLRIAIKLMEKKEVDFIDRQTNKSFFDLVNKYCLLGGLFCYNVIMLNDIKNLLKQIN